MVGIGVYPGGVGRHVSRERVGSALECVEDVHLFRARVKTTLVLYYYVYRIYDSLPHACFTDTNMLY